jgi:hypothetical protein
LPSFLSLPENKEDLAFFLATELIRQAPEGKVVVTGGGIISEDQTDSNDKSLNLDNLKATHEEADMRMILHMLHCKNVSNCQTIAVSATDTDVFFFYYIILTEWISRYGCWQECLKAQRLYQCTLF